MARYDVAAFDDVPTDTGLLVTVEGQDIALFRIGDDVLATQDMCTHADASLADGFVRDGCVECPLHMAEFDIRTGEALSPPAKEPLKTFAVTVLDGRVHLEL